MLVAIYESQTHSPDPHWVIYGPRRETTCLRGFSQTPKTGFFASTSIQQHFYMIFFKK